MVQSGAQATVEVTQVNCAASFAFGLPKGSTGPNGEKGDHCEYKCTIEHDGHGYYLLQCEDGKKVKCKIVSDGADSFRWDFALDE